MESLLPILAKRFSVETVLLLFLGYMLFMSIVQGMPEPPTDASLLYRWAFSALHSLAMNHGLVKKVAEQHARLARMQRMDEKSQKAINSIQTRAEPPLRMPPANTPGG